MNDTGSFDLGARDGSDEACLKQAFKWLVEASLGKLA